jgi:hypothetical protein
VAGFIGDIPRCDGGAMASTNERLGLGGEKFGSPKTMVSNRLSAAQLIDSNRIAVIAL